MKAQSVFTLALLLSGAVIASRCAPYDDDFDDDFHHRPRDFDRDHKNPPGDRPNQNGPQCDAGTVIIVVPRADSGVVEVPDAGEEPPPPVDAGEEPPPPVDAGVPCEGENCPCLRDSDCPPDQVCNHARRICEAPPVYCTDITVEAECLARTDCQAIYGGQNCTDSTGGECVSGDVDCTCEIFTFAACILRP